VDLDGRYDFDTIVVGPANRLAVAAALAVAENPGATYNPLYIWSASGLGKTHLLMAIGRRARTLQPSLQVTALTVDEFVRQLHSAVSMGDAASFDRRFQDTGLLLIDDVQLMTGRRETQAALLRLCQEFHSAGRQIVFAGDRPPGDIADADEQLVAQLSGGLVVDIGAPDYEARTRILSNWCAERGVSFGPGVIEALGHAFLHNVRELQGALSKVLAFQSAGGRAAVVGVADIHRLFPESRPAAHASNGHAPRTSGSRSAPAAEFLNFISDVATVVARHVEPWRARIGEAAERWAGEGYDTGVLQRAMRAEADPGSAALIATYERCVGRLRTLEYEAAAIDASLATMDVFHDPARVAAAEELVARARQHRDTANQAPQQAGEAYDEPADNAGYDNGVEDPVELLDVVDVVDVVDAPEADNGGTAEPDQTIPVSVVARRTSRGMVITSIVADDPFFLDDEKVVWDWPDALGRVIEEFR
jgi:chromosomal replication initiator protein